MIFTKLISHFGNQKKTAAALGVDQSAVSGWLRSKHGMSPLIAIRAEKITEGKFLKSELCPRVFSENEDSPTNLHHGKSGSSPEP